jgi:amino acid adenylation domain-containing protein/thioester reductase-like protein
MEGLVYDQCLKHPDDAAIIDEEHTLTYSMLLAESLHIMHNIGKYDGELAPEEPVGIILGAGTKQIISQFAVLLIGGTCVPIEPTLPEKRITDLLHSVGVKRIVIEEDGPYCSKEFGHLYISDVEERSTIDGDYRFDFSDRDEGTHRSHILFTSGSTGKPKPVQITARGILHLATRTPATPLRPSDRVAEFNNPGFDLSLFEIWATLLAGATIVVVPKHIVTDPKRLEGFLKDPEHQVSVIFMTAALFEVIGLNSPTAFQGLRHVLTGGDVANMKAIRAVLENGPPEHLWNTYGPTECVTLTTMCEVTPDEANKERIGIGKPVGDMRICLVDPDKELEIINESGKVGEICIAGPQQSPGYLNEQPKNDKSFINLDRNKLQRNWDGGGSVRLYRTGDLAEWRAFSGELDFVGRVDNQIKHKGFRIHPGEIAMTIVSYKQVKSAVVVQRPSSTPHGSPSLVAFIITETNMSVGVDQLKQFLAERLPSYMVPDEIIVLDKFPLTSNGKVDRKGLIDQHTLPQKSTQKTDISPSQSGDGHALSVIRSLWREILNVPKIDDDGDFFALGGTSLQSAKLITLIHERLDVLISMQELYENSSLPGLLKLIHEFKSSTATEAPDDSAVWTGEMKLVDDINLVDDIETVPDWLSEDEGHVFMTGATGFVGAFFLSHLLHHPRVKQVACLARGKDSLTLAERIQKGLERYDLWPSNSKLTEKIVPLEGDITDDKLGLGEQFSWLSNWASVIFHLGAKVNFTETYRQHYSANVIGTRNVLRLAASGRRKPFHYMSTIDAWGGTTGYLLRTRVLKEEDPLEPHVQSVRFDIGYAQSQYTAEGMVRRMRDKGLPIIIYRPGFIIGHSRTGASNPDDFMSRLIVGCIQIGMFPKLIQRLEYVTVDYVVEAAMHIASSNENLGRSYHLLAPDRSLSVTMEDTCRIINQAGYPVELIDYWTWAKHVARKQRPNGPLAPLMPMIEEKVLGEQTRWQLSQFTPKYDSSNAVGALRARADIHFKPLDVQLLKGYIDFWNRKGFYNV